MLASTVYINGELLGLHEGGYTPFSFEITELIAPGENVLTVCVDATEDKSIPPYGDFVDFLTFGGLYRDVFLRIVAPCHIVNAFARPTNVLTSPGLECDVQLAQWVPGLQIEGILEDTEGRVVAQQVQDVGSDSISVSFPELGQVALWSLEDPTLYNLVLVLSLDGEPVDKEVVRFGFRSTEFRDDGRFYFNGKPLKLFGLNRHQTYPYIGAAAPARLQRLDAEILKYELGCNIVRTSHYPQSPHFLDRCDEIGLLVFEELAGWQHIGDEAWQALALQDLQAMIERDRNHPSIVLWGVRINESLDNDELYTRTNALAHELDSTRQTGGVRNFIESKLLEDVFTLNDFTEGIQTPLVRPHLITEFAGHMFPTKTWDHEERRIEHALKHARKHSLQIGHPDVAGAIGWCAFDYNTHEEFGSGDRICYHGVMDIYRLPKMAAYFYRSQKSPEDEIVLYPATHWTLGDRAGGGNNPLTVFSNCETIEILVGDRSLGFFEPDRDQYPNLKHPPFTMRWPEPFNPWHVATLDLTVRGYVNGDVVAEHRIASDHVPHGLRLSTHTTHLKPDGADMARIAVQIVDRYGSVLPYQARIVEFTLEGDAELIGENPLVLLGGQGACYLKARHTAGRVKVQACTDDLPPASVEFEIGA
jgi:beta-galactosidase